MCQAAVLLVLLAVGYWVLTLSQTQQKPLNIVGRILGVIILLGALGGLICGAMCTVRGGSCGSSMCASSGKAACGMKAGCDKPCGAGKAGCPMMDKAAAAPAAEAPAKK